MENKINFTNLVICSVCCSRYLLLYCQAVDLQMNQTVEYHWGVSRILGFAGKCFLFSRTPPPSIFHFFCSSYLYCYFSPSTNRCEQTTTVPLNDQRSPGVQSLFTKVRDGRLISMVVIGASNTAGRNWKKNKELYSVRFTDWWNKHVYKSTGSRLTLNIRVSVEVQVIFSSFVCKTIYRKNNQTLF